MSLLEVEGLRVRLPTRAACVTVVDGVDYAVEHGEVFGVAGESGSGKTMSMLALLGLAARRRRRRRAACASTGATCCACRARRCARSPGRELAMVFQDPLTSLHPMLSIGRQLTEHVRLPPRARPARRRAAARSSCSRRSASRIRRRALRAFPHQFSGGMRQRIAIAIALACRPEAADRRRADDGARRHRAGRDPPAARPPPPRERPRRSILITHDLGVMSAIADRVSIFYAGRVVESGSREAVLQRAAPPVHARAARRAAASRGGAGPAARRDRRRAAEPRAHPARVRVPPALRVRAGDCRARRAAARRRRATALLACPVDPFVGR